MEEVLCMDLAGNICSAQTFLPPAHSTACAETNQQRQAPAKAGLTK